MADPIDVREFPKSVMPLELTSELMGKIKNEVLRRSGFKADSYGNILYDENGNPVEVENNHISGAIMSEYHPEEFELDPTEYAGGEDGPHKIKSKHGQQFVGNLLTIADFHTMGGKRLTKTPGDFDNIPVGFDKPTMENMLSSLASESYYEASSSCRSWCTGLCVGTCGVGCFSDCSKDCGGCTGACTNNCAGQCGDTCRSECTTTCMTSCTGKCIKGCLDGCKSSCKGGCKSSCKGGCNTTCTGTCNNTCQGTCNTGCTGGCTGACTGLSGGTFVCSNCNSGCVAGCSVGCIYACSGGACTGSCKSSCDGGCSGTNAGQITVISPTPVNSPSGPIPATASPISVTDTIETSKTDVGTVSYYKIGGGNTEYAGVRFGAGGGVESASGKASSTFNVTVNYPKTGTITEGASTFYYDQQSGTAYNGNTMIGGIPQTGSQTEVQQFIQRTLDANADKTTQTVSSVSDTSVRKKSAWTD